MAIVKIDPPTANPPVGVSPPAKTLEQAHPEAVVKQPIPPTKMVDPGLGPHSPPIDTLGPLTPVVQPERNLISDEAGHPALPVPAVPKSMMDMVQLTIGKLDLIVAKLDLLITKP